MRGKCALRGLSFPRRASASGSPLRRRRSGELVSRKGENMPLAAPRPTPQILEPSDRVFSVAANVTCYQGGLAMLVNGYAQPGAAAVGAIGLGRFEYTVSNLGGAAGAVSVKVRAGVFKYATLTTTADIILPAQIGQPCYIVDDQTVAATNGGTTRSVAGTVWQVDGDGGVWVRF
jgi:hypothetical protein